MRALLAAVLLTVSGMSVAAPVAFADGIERPRAPRPAPRPRPRAPVHRPAPPVVAPPVVVPQGPETVTLQPSMFTGGVGLDIGTGYVGGGGRTIVIAGSSASAVAISYASASARASAGFRGGHRGGHGGGCGGCR